MESCGEGSFYLMSQKPVFRTPPNCRHCTPKPRPAEPDEILAVAHKEIWHVSVDRFNVEQTHFDRETVSLALLEQDTALCRQRRE